jgi:hypothetical protein
MTDTPSSGGRTGEQPPPEDQATADLTAALGHLRDAVDRLRQEIEVNAREEWVRAKPELKSTLADLQQMIDAAAERAKILLEDLGKRLDRED